MVGLQVSSSKIGIVSNRWLQKACLAVISADKLVTHCLHDSSHSTAHGLLTCLCLANNFHVGISLHDVISDYKVIMLSLGLNDYFHYALNRDYL